MRETLLRALAGFPSIIVTGPRQSGKTTFVRHVLGGTHRYVSLDDPLELRFATDDPNGFLDRFGDSPVVLDEIQYAPELLTFVKLRIDERRNVPGRWVLIGSQQFSVMKGVSESLAGRVAVLELLPFSVAERTSFENVTLDCLVWTGGYPEPALKPDIRDIWVTSYLRTYVERDVRSLLGVTDLRAFEIFIGLCAARHAQAITYAELARASGVTQPTVKSWIGVLAASYLLHELRPFFKNYGKRLVKRSKGYLLDAALVTALTRQPTAEAALAGAMGGALFEGLVVTEAVKAFAARGRRPDIYYWRSHDGLEVDLIVQAGGELHPVEIKLTATPTAGHTTALDKFRALAGDEAADKGIIVCRVAGRRALPRGNLALPWEEFPGWLADILDA